MISRYERMLGPGLAPIGLRKPSQTSLVGDVSVRIWKSSQVMPNRIGPVSDALCSRKAKERVVPFALAMRMLSEPIDLGGIFAPGDEFAQQRQEEGLAEATDGRIGLQIE